MGRDARVDRTLAARRQQSDVAKMLESGGRSLPPVLDRVGNVLEAGDIVQYAPPFPLFFQIAEIKPVLHPNAPPGSVAVMLVATFPIQKQAGHPNLDLLFVGIPSAPNAETPTPAPPAEEVPAAAPQDDRPELVLTDAVRGD